MTTPHALDHAQNVYLIVTLSSSSLLSASTPVDESALSQAHPALTAHGPVGELRDIHLLSVPRETWPAVRQDVISSLNALEGVLRVDVQDGARTRMKRGAGGDEF